MAWALTQSGFSHDLAASMAAVPGGQTGFLLISIAAFIVLGSVLEGIPAIVLFGPLLFPVARQLGVHEVHYDFGRFTSSAVFHQCPFVLIRGLIPFPWPPKQKSAGNA